MSATARAAANGQASNPTKSVTLTLARFFIDDFHPSESTRSIWIPRSRYQAYGAPEEGDAVAGAFAGAARRRPSVSGHRSPGAGTASRHGGYECRPRPERSFADRPETAESLDVDVLARPITLVADDRLRVPAGADVRRHSGVAPSRRSRRADRAGSVTIEGSYLGVGPRRQAARARATGAEAGASAPGAGRQARPSLLPGSDARAIAGRAACAQAAAASAGL
jgi:hypothetical protein